MTFRLLPVALTLLLAGCEIPGLGPDPRVAQREADGKAIGGACRHALRGIEDCYGLNEKAIKTAVFEGWKEMDLYMRENKIEGIAPKEAKAQETEEVVLEEKRPRNAGTDKMIAETRPKTDAVIASKKPVEKTVAKAAPH